MKSALNGGYLPRPALPCRTANTTAALGVRIGNGGKIGAILNDSAGGIVAVVIGGFPNFSYNAAHGTVGVDITGNGQIPNRGVNGPKCGRIVVMLDIPTPLPTKITGSVVLM